jgi:hypothetical protein
MRLQPLGLAFIHQRILCFTIRKQAEDLEPAEPCSTRTGRSPVPTHSQWKHRLTTSPGRL